jgi:hypothetical protein
MQICKPNDGQAPTIKRDINEPGLIPRKSNPTLAEAIAEGWREYVPLASTPANARIVTGVDGGGRYTETVAEVWTDEELAAQETQRQAEAAAAQAAEAAALLAMQSELDNAERITKGLALTILDELNRLSARIRAFDAAVAASTSLANLQTRTAALAAIPDRTAAQLKAAIKAKVEGL